MAERVLHEIPRFDKIAGAILNAACGGPQGGGQEPDIIPPMWKCSMRRHKKTPRLKDGVLMKHSCD